MKGLEIQGMWGRDAGDRLRICNGGEKIDR